MIESKKLDALKGHLFSGASTVFTILDGATVPDLPQKLASFEPGYVCLYRGDLEPDMAEVAPYLVILEEESPFTEWVLTNGWGQHWGIFGNAQGHLSALRKHFRNFVMVHDECGKPLYFRYYDPRVLRVYLRICNTRDLNIVFGPVTLYVIEGLEVNVCNLFTFRDTKRNHEKVTLP